MKARLLKKLLNDTKYTISDYGAYVAVGSPMCHNLLAVDKDTLRVTYALDTFHRGREAIGNAELTFIWDRLHELIATGEIKDIIEGVDQLSAPLPVYTIENGELIETTTDQYGWPNTTFDGLMMYDNTYFKNKHEALSSGIDNETSHLEWTGRKLVELELELEELRENRLKHLGYLDNLKTLQSKED